MIEKTPIEEELDRLRRGNTRKVQDIINLGFSPPQTTIALIRLELLIEKAVGPVDSANRTYFEIEYEKRMQVVWDDLHKQINLQILKKNNGLVMPK
jgi:hypothetical protein